MICNEVNASRILTPLVNHMKMWPLCHAPGFVLVKLENILGLKSYRSVEYRFSSELYS